MDYNSPKNKKILQAFCEKECFADMTDIVEFILESSLVSADAPFDDTYIENEGNSNKLSIQIKAEMDELEKNEPDDITSDEWIKWYEKYSSLESDLDALDMKVKWIAVSSWLGFVLREEDEQVIDCSDYFFWAIPEGQDVVDQEVLARIAEKVEILEGQKNDWSKCLE